MADSLKVEFKAPGALSGGDLVVFVGEDLKPTPAVARQIGAKAVELIARAAPIERFKGKAQTAMTIAAPAAPAVDRLIAVGVGGEPGKVDLVQLGGFVAGRIAGKEATVLADLPGVESGPEGAADLALGARLRGYSFDLYKTKKKDDSDESGAPARITLHVPDPSDARKALRKRLAIGGGVTRGNPNGFLVIGESHPTALGAGWTVTMFNLVEQADTATPYVVCANPA